MLVPRSVLFMIGPFLCQNPTRQVLLDDNAKILKQLGRLHLRVLRKVHGSKSSTGIP